MSHYHLNFLTHLSITGVDAQKFLQSQLTCDVNALAVGESTLGAHCNLQGKVISLSYLLRTDEQTFLMSLPKDICSAALAHLKKYSMFSKVNIESEPEGWMHVGALAETDIPNAPYTITHDETRTEIIGPASDFESLELEKLDTTDNNPWLVQSMAAGIPFLSADTQGTFIPQDLNLDKLGAVSFNKGCYLGQEVVARVHYKGKLKRSMQCFDAPQENGKLICQANYHNTNAYLYLA
jgi:folate-binding protein YgfZ